MIVREGNEIDPELDWPGVASDWLVGYRSRVEDVRKGIRPWRNLDALQQETFDELSKKFGLDKLNPCAISEFRNV